MRLKTIFILFIIVLCSKIIAAQDVFHQSYAVEKDKPWVDSLKRVISKGFVLNTQSKNNWKQQLAYVNNCITLGIYYEKLFEKQQVPDMQRALFYYNKVIDLGRFPDDERYFKALAIRTTLFRKLAAVYFKGKGVKKNRKLSLELALQGFIGKLFSFYSKRYFNCECIFLDTKMSFNYDTTTFFTFKVNPFTKYGFKKELISKQLFEIANAFKKRQAEGNTDKIFLQKHCSASMREQAYSNTLLESIKRFFVEQMHIEAENILMNIEIDGEQNLEIIFTKG